MPVTKLIKPGAKVAPRVKPGPEVGVQVSLPTTISEPKAELSDYSMLIFGEKKIGKTTLAAQFPNCFLMMFEAGGKALRAYQANVPDWGHFTAYIDLLEKDKKYKTVCVDTIDEAYERCFEHMCKKVLIISHPNDENDFGKSWKEIDKEFRRQFARLLRLDLGFIGLSHSTEKELTTRSGAKFNRLMPTMGNQAARYFEGVVDIWAYYGYQGRQRELVIRGDEYIGAGIRLQENFNTKGGEPIETISMGNSPKEAYTNIVTAFNNKQFNTGGKAIMPKRTVKQLRRK